MLATAGRQMAKPSPWWLFLSFSATLQMVSMEQGAVPACPPQCHCEEDGIMLSVDCSELSLTSVPDSLSSFTAYLDLSMNNISELFPGDFRHLRFLEELRLSGNQLSKIPGETFSGLYNLKILMLQNNQLSRIPAEALCDLPNLQSLHLHNNQIQSLGMQGFEGLHSLETLDLNYNELVEFPVAIRTLSQLQELGFHNNNIKAIPEKAFAGNPLLQIMTLTRAGIHLLPGGMCQQLPSLRVLELSHNQIEELPSFHRCQKLEEIGLQHNQIHEIRADTFWQLTALRSIDLSWNSIRTIHPEAFVTLPSLIKLDLTDNQLVTLPSSGLSALTHLKLKGNPALSESFPKENFPKMRVLEVPYAYQCCAYGACGNFFKASSQWDSEDVSPEDEDGHKRSSGQFPSHADNHYDLDMEDFQLEMEDSKLRPNTQCTPSPGPFKPCDHLFESWVIRLGVWLIMLVSILCNGLVMVVVFASPGYLSPVKFVIGSIAGTNLLTGMYCAILAFVDTITFGHFAKYGARWETGAGCQVTGFLSVFASEASILLLTLAAIQCSLSVSCMKTYGKVPSFGTVKAGAMCCLTLSSVAAALPLFSVGEYGTSPLCLPYALPDGKPSMLGFMVGLVLVNTLCFLIITGTYIGLYCNLLKGEFDSVWDCAMIKHVAWLIFINCLLYCPVAFLTFSSMLSLFLITPEVIKSVLLVVLPLPACLNPLLYLLFNPHFRDDLRLLRQKSQTQESCVQSYVSDDTEKSSYDSTQALVPFSDTDHVFEAPDIFRMPSRCPPVLDAYNFPSVTLIPCQQKAGTRRHNSDFSTHLSCLADNELLIDSESKDAARNSLQTTLFPTSPAPAFTSHL
ncbi:leucine-rich repeat-containing G-protein coupled receptor 6 isoform X4 [Sphaerodactylus townsendi]|uniref:leucine-rich repeat-containing G-protein coupled receptor 6 isoform X4 n=1 Tax=Sphaerodactylus townsendi TaxID=933632 RepID=UPI002025EF6D|nr:leucine-rich repeat-containing G-protein coupled receptor 6 isoform X4 [Sphaerodactylus townsendi]